MYAWYFPRGREAISALEFRPFGHRHNWESVIIWLDKLSLKNSKILGTSTYSFAWAGLSKYSSHVPLNEKYLNGSSVKIDYHNNFLLSSTEVRVTEKEGEYQDLITWDQLPDAARDALSNTDWDLTPMSFYGTKMPLRDAGFIQRLERAWPFE
ncbi:Necrosis inducing protein NPP1 [Phytophthora megakarya]|uniref:Necrosis inducing protein NPP1 n=1 Tax=Phytophthora megakarya TaxID=4795 RepID=A0A225V435_9STRA|nr:Necrosis inducing protein NPP1 [Phytophthora megakarya]